MDALLSLDLTYFLLVSLGVLIGIIFGAIPGMTATMAVAVCLPMTYALDLNHGLALLLGLYVGGISGGLVPAILINIPGTPSSITTCFDGYPMTQNGEPEKALKIGIVSSLVGGLFSAVVLYYFAPSLANWAIKFSYVEKFLIILFALTVIASLSKRLLIGIFSGVLGVWVSLIGVYDMSSGNRLLAAAGAHRSVWAECDLWRGGAGRARRCRRCRATEHTQAFQVVGVQGPVPQPAALFKHRDLHRSVAWCRGQRGLGAGVFASQELLR
jgi:TctA family transporter